MMSTFSTVALLNCLGYEKARAVLFEMNSVERFKLAFDAATTRLGDGDIESTIDVVFSHLSVGEQEHVSEQWCSDCNMPESLDQLSDAQLALLISYLTPNESGSLLNDNRQRCAGVAHSCRALGTLDHLGYSLSELSCDSRSEIIDLIAEKNVDIANQLQIRFNGLVDILELDYDELAAVLGGAPVEEIANALMAAGHSYA